MMKRSYFSAGSDGIGGSGGSRRSLGYGSGSGSGSGGSRRFGTSSTGSGAARYGNSNLGLDDDADAVLGAAADAALSSKVELASYFAAEAEPSSAQAPANDWTTLEEQIENDENNYAAAAAATDRVVTKKPFLRKGSRREPSSFHRFHVGSGGASAAAAAALASPNIEVEDMPQPQQQPPPPSSATSLEALEKMQQDQVDDLERRMARRREAREMQQRRKRGVVHGKDGSASGGGAAAMTRAPYATEEDVPVVLEGGSSGGGGSINASGRKQQPLQRSGGKMTGAPRSSGSSAKRKVGARLPLQATGRNGGSGGKGLAAATTSSARPMTSSAAIRGGGHAQHRRQHQHHGANDGDETSTVDPAQLLVQKQRNDEQWSLLKSMRRRQEAALRDAEQERETVRSWAASEKESVTKWANEQRSLVRRERHRASTVALASHRERQKEEKEQQDAYEELERSSREEIATLRMTVDKLRMEMEGGKAKYRMNERKLRDKVKSQGEMIRQLKSEVRTGSSSTPSASQNQHQQSSWSSTRHGTSSSGSNATRTVAFGSTLPRETKPRSFAKKCASGNRAMRDSYDGNDLDDQNGGRRMPIEEARADATEEEETRGDVDDGDVISTGEEEEVVAMVDKTPAQVIQSKPDPTATTSTVVQGEKTPMATEMTQAEDLVEETTEQWMKRLQERHNTLPFGTTTPAPSEKDELLARANQLMSGGSAGANSVHRSSGIGGSNQKPPPNPSLSYMVGMNPLAPLSVGPRAYPVAQQTPDPHLVTSTSIEALGSAEGKRIISYSNGTTKETLPDGTARVSFANGDIKTTYAHQNVTIYYYAAAETTHTTHPDGLEVFQFANKQTEKHFPDGRKEVYFVDGTVKMINADGSSETTFPDGVRIVEMTNGTKQIIRG